jgi:hypothetical protein
VHDNALIWLQKPFLRTSKRRIHDPSEIRALEFKGRFKRFGICSVSTAIGSNRSIRSESRAGTVRHGLEKKDRHSLRTGTSALACARSRSLEEAVTAAELFKISAADVAPGIRGAFSPPPHFAKFFPALVKISPARTTSVQRRNWAAFRGGSRPIPAWLTDLV